MPTLHRSPTAEHRRQFAPQQREVLETVNHVYEAPFLYDNIVVGDFYEIDPDKGIELKALDGYITVEEAAPIVSVTVVGSGCVPRGFNICEWWDDEEDTDRMKDGIVKRQRVDDLNGIHPSIGMQMMMNTFPGLTFRTVTGGRCNSAFEALRLSTWNYYGEYCLNFHENTATFRVGPPYPRRITVRSGALMPEDRGDRMRYPGDYAIRVIETAVKAGEE